ncbi:Sigma-70, region 4 [compost metagenome]
MKLSFRLSRYENKSIKEIAAELSLSEQTVRNNISMALERLRLQTRKFYAEPANLAGVIVVLLINT